MQVNYKIFKDLIQTVGLLYLFYCLFWRYIIKKISENDKLSGHFQRFFFVSSNPKSEKKNPVKKLIKKSGLSKTFSYILRDDYQTKNETNN